MKKAMSCLKNLSVKDRTEIIKYYVYEDYCRDLSICIYYCEKCGDTGSDTGIGIDGRNFLECFECKKAYCENCWNEKISGIGCINCTQIFCYKCEKKGALPLCEICEASYCKKCIQEEKDKHDGIHCSECIELCDENCECKKGKNDKE